MSSPSRPQVLVSSKFTQFSWWGHGRFTVTSLFVDVGFISPLIGVDNTLIIYYILYNIILYILYLIYIYAIYSIYSIYYVIICYIYMWYYIIYIMLYTYMYPFYSWPGMNDRNPYRIFWPWPKWICTKLGDTSCLYVCCQHDEEMMMNSWFLVFSRHFQDQKNHPNFEVPTPSHIGCVAEATEDLMYISLYLYIHSYTVFVLKCGRWFRCMFGQRTKCLWFPAANAFDFANLIYPQGKFVAVSLSHQILLVICVKMWPHVFFPAKWQWHWNGTIDNSWLSTTSSVRPCCRHMTMSCCQKYTKH